MDGRIHTSTTPISNTQLSLLHSCSLFFSFKPFKYFHQYLFIYILLPKVCLCQRVVKPSNSCSSLNLCPSWIHPLPVNSWMKATCLCQALLNPISLFILRSASKSSIGCSLADGCIWNLSQVHLFSMCHNHLKPLLFVSYNNPSSLIIYLIPVFMIISLLVFPSTAFRGSTSNSCTLHFSVMVLVSVAYICTGNNTVRHIDLLALKGIWWSQQIR